MSLTARIEEMPAVHPLPVAAGALPPEAAAQLREAFEVFNEATATFTTQYARLERRVAELNLELESANRRLRSNLAEKERVEAYLSTLLESLPVGVVGVDVEGRVCSANRAAGEILEREPEALASARLADLLGAAAAEEARAAVAHWCGQRTAQVALVDVPEAFELEMLSHRQSAGGGCPARGSGRRIVRLQLVPAGLGREVLAQRAGARGADGQVVALREAAAVLLMEDVTDVRHLEQQATRTSRLTAMGEIAINVAHEIRNPLGSIELFASMLQRDLADQPAQATLAGHICTGVRCLDHIVSNILQFSRPQLLSCSTFDLNALMDETVLFAEHVLRQKNIRVERRGQEDEILMHADAELLRQVFLNLVLNAIQATPEDGTIGLEALPSGRRVEVRVWDTGCGLAPEVLGRIFDPFFTTRRKGTGLGLTIVHNILASHQGTIDAENRPEGGALFTMALPLRLSPVIPQETHPMYALEEIRS